MSLMARYLACCKANCHVDSQELNRQIDEDFCTTRHSWEDQDLERDLLWKNPYIETDAFNSRNKFDAMWDSFCHTDLLPEALLPYSIMVNPRTGIPIPHPFKLSLSPKKNLPQTVEPKELPKPYHPYQDHDYLKIKEEDEGDEKLSALEEVESLFKSDAEPTVEVWEIDNLIKNPPGSDPIPQQLPSSYRQTARKETRRVSTRTAEIRRREQARKISNAVHAVLKNDKARKTRQYKSIKPKNSVETTPSQSDIEEWCSQPARPTYTKITKKKTSKGRIDHSESERHRREVLRRNFSSLCDLIPHKYLRGEKVSSQISKQKILNGAKAYILAIHKAKSSYKSKFHQNKLLRDRWETRVSSKLVKSVKKQK